MKKLKKSLVLLLVGFGLIFGLSTQTSADTWNFTTHDGKWDGAANPTYSKPNVQVDVYPLQGEIGRPGFELEVRLCNANTGNCTVFKNVQWIKSGYGRVHFTNMKPGKYFVDIWDNVPGPVSGITTTVEY
ncbi:hypothetical protein R4Z09_19750 [Niallia oryzisoli]|uniref:Uncharacterized protein n=1 Tax=Niallia oryzisoli TaxID=1737571 RepID=A0ABZ2C833_9BACI